MGLAAIIAALAVASSVHHAVLHGPGPPVAVWQDASGETALRYTVESRVTLVRGTSVFTVEEGVVKQRNRFRTAAEAWSLVHEQYGVTRAEVSAALAAGDLLPRPAVMSIPRRDPTYFIDVEHFGRDVASFRRAVSWWVPSPQRSVAGLPLDDDQLLQSPLFGRLATEEYRTGARLLSFQTPTPGSDWARASAHFFRLSRRRLDDDARFTDGGLIVRRGATYVTVVTQAWSPAPSQWQAIAAAARA
jgi:hypothetical protein